MPAAVEHALVLGLCCDDVVLLAGALEETRYTLDAHIVTLGGTAGEDDLLGVGSNEVSNVRASILDGLVRLPSIGVCARVRVAVEAGHEGQLGVDDAGVGGRGGLHIQVDGPCSLVHDCGLLQDACSRQ